MNQVTLLLMIGQLSDNIQIGVLIAIQCGFFIMYIARNRKPQRLKNRDYSKNGYYFVTFCSRFFVRWFGKIEDDEMVLNQYGRIVEKFILEIPKHYSGVYIDEFVIMPNHIHLIIIIYRKNQSACCVGTEQCSVPTQPGQKNFGLLSTIIKSYKGIVTKQIRKEFSDYTFQWQRSFHDRVIRNHNELNRIRNYIKNNPANWKQDCNNKTF